MASHIALVATCQVLATVSCTCAGMLLHIFKACLHNGLLAISRWTTSISQLCCMLGKDCAVCSVLVECVRHAQAQHRPLPSLLCSKPSAAFVKSTVLNRYGCMSPDDAVCGTSVAQPLQDVLARVAGGSCGVAAGSLLLLGPPGVGNSQHCLPPQCFRRPLLCIFLPAMLCVPSSLQHLCVGMSHNGLISSQNSAAMHTLGLPDTAKQSPGGHAAVIDPKLE